MDAQFQKQRANDLAEKTQDAYSADRWGNSWRALALLLVRRGWDNKTVEAILRSKYTRWASDNRAGDQPVVADFKTFMRASPNYFTKEALVQLVKETF